MKLHSLAQLHSYRGRRSGAVRLGRESWCLAIDSDFAGTQRRSDVVEAQKALPTNASATDAVSSPTATTLLVGSSGHVKVRFLLPPPSTNTVFRS